MISCFNKGFRKWFCHFTVNNKIALFLAEKVDCGRLVLHGLVSNSIVAPLTDVKISLSEVIICQVLMDSVMQPTRKWVHLLSKCSLRSRTKDGNSVTTFLMFSKDCIMSSQFSSSKSWVFSDPSLKKAVCSLQASSVCHSFLGGLCSSWWELYGRKKCVVPALPTPMSFPILLVSLASRTCFVRSAPKSRSERLLDSFAWEQSKWNLALLPGKWIEQSFWPAFWGRPNKTGTWRQRY